jgi:hypothetical protein
MWMLRNLTPYAAERNWVRDKHGAHHWIVAVKATFDILGDGSLKLADEQNPPLFGAEYFGEPGASSVRYEADLGPMKPATDVIALAHAYTPGGKPQSSVSVSLRIGALQKTLVVYGERIYHRGLRGVVPGEAQPFIKRPVQYELAFGGTDTTDPDPGKHAIDKRNPIGRGFAVHSRSLVDQPAPSIEYPQGDPERMGPAGFGPLASYWSPRLELAGTYDARWAQTKKPLLPDDYDDRFTLCAPADQRLPQYLRGGELIELGHMTPQGVMRFSLPKVYLVFRTSIGRRREEHRSRLVSVVIEPGETRLMVTWQTSLEVASSDAEYLDETVIDEKPYLT